MRHAIATLRSEEHRIFSWIYLSTLLLSLHYVFVVYINSSFLSSVAGEKMVGFFYMTGSLFSLFVFLNISKLLRILGNWKTMTTALILEAGCLAIFAISRNPFIILLFFILHQGVAPVLLFNLDIFLETYLKTETHTGGVRGIFLTLSNLAFVVGPVLVGTLLSNFPYYTIYLTSLFFLIPLFIIIKNRFSDFEDAAYRKANFSKTLAVFGEDKNIRNIYLTNLLLQVFYAWMVIYTPLYLHSHLGFSWAEIGEMFSIMLLPFIIFEIPGGLLADRKLGEKELLLLGFLIMGGATILLALVAGNSFLWWTVLLFTTRIGASLVEIMSETYFFKHVRGKDSNLISFFRTAGPVAYIITPLFSGLLLSTIGFKFSFLLIGLITLLGLIAGSRIKDTL